MPTFTYAARTRDGKKQTGSMTADNRQAVVRALQNRGLLADTVEEKGKEGGRRRSPRIGSHEVMVFTRQLSTIIDAGLPLLVGLDILSEQSEDPRFSKDIEEVGGDIEAGESFSDALRKHPGAFSDLYVSMVNSGEVGGNLSQVLAQLADYMEAMEELKRRIRSAMTYPVVAFSMILLIAAGLVIWVVPMFKEIFDTLTAGGPGKPPVALPMPTQILIYVSEVLQSLYAFLVLGVFIAAIIAIRVYGQTENGRLNIDRIKLRLPVFGKLLRKVAISRFARTLSTLLDSGVAILAALEIAERTAGNEVYARTVRAAGDCVRKGETLAEPLARSGEYPAMVTRMISVGEKAGAVGKMLSKISEFYEAEVKAAIDGLTSLIEPILIMLMGIVVGGIVIALFMPILELPSLINR